MNNSAQNLHRRRRLASNFNSPDSNSSFASENETYSHHQPPFRRDRTAFSTPFTQPTASLLDDKTGASLNPGGSSFGAGNFGPPESTTRNSPDFRFDSAIDANLSDFDMAFGDRTQEFRTIGKNLQLKLQQTNSSSTRVPKSKTSRMIAESALFNQYAKKIGADLGATFAKLEKLTLLAKKKSIFDDRLSEIDELTQIIKRDIGGMNRQIAQLQELMAKRHEPTGGGADGKNQQSTSHSKSIVLGLQSKLAAMSNEFKSVLEIRTENLKQQKSRREKLGGGRAANVPSSLPVSASTGRMGSVLLSDEESHANGSILLDMDSSDQQRLQSQTTLIDQRDSYVRNRADAMQNIESTIVDLGQIFSQLAHMVTEQGEMVQRIDSHVDEANLNVEAAHTQLLEYMRSISSNRWLALKVFGVLIVFFIIFIVFLT